MKMSNNEVVVNVTLSVKEIADGRLMANLFGHKVRRSDIREKNDSLCVRSPSILFFLEDELDVTYAIKRFYVG